MNHAFIDIGTNTILLLIAEIKSDQRFNILHDECRIVRLGEDIDHTRRFLESAMQRTLEALQDYKQIIDKFRCVKTTTVGTAGFRKAQNPQDFIDLVNKKIPGLEIKIISGETEANLIYRATKHDFKDLQSPCIVLDIGGGSTELIIEDAQNPITKSMPFGTVSLTEKFLHSDPPKQSELQSLKDFVTHQLTTHFDSSHKRQNKILIATAGTPTTLAAIHQRLKTYDAKKIHHSQLQSSDLVSLIKKLESLNLSERSQIDCLPKKRADVIIAGSYILQITLDFFELESFWISDRGLRYGLLYTTLQATSI